MEYLNELATVVFYALPEVEKERLSKKFPDAVWTHGEADTEMQSVCCGAAKHEYIDDMCSGCNEIVTFEEVAI